MRFLQVIVSFFFKNHFPVLFRLYHSTDRNDQMFWAMGRPSLRISRFIFQVSIACETESRAADTLGTEP